MNVGLDCINLTFRFILGYWLLDYVNKLRWFCPNWNVVLQRDNSVLIQMIRNMITAWGAMLIRGAIGIFLVPIYIDNFGLEGYGVVGLLGVLLGMTFIADLGLRNALGRELSEQHARKDSIGYSELISTALVLYTLISLILASAIYVKASWIVGVFNVPIEDIDSTVRIVRVYGPLSVVLSFITPVFTSGLASKNRFDIVNNIRMITGVTTSIILISVIKIFNVGIWAWIYVQLGSQLVILILLIVHLNILDGGLCFRVSRIRVARLKPLFSLGGYMYLIQFAQTISERSDPMVITHYFGPAGVALYSPGNKLTKVVRPIALTMVSQLFPLTTKHHVQKSLSSLRSLLVLGTKYTLLMGIPISLFLCVYSKDISKIWLFDSLGQDYRTVAFIMAGWAVTDFFTYCGGSQWPVLLGMKKVKFTALLQIPLAISNILLSIYFVGFTKYGIVGVIFATIVIAVIRRVAIFVYATRQCEISIGRYLRQAYLRPMILFIMLLLQILITRYFFQVSSWIGLLLHVFVMVIAWIILAWKIGLNSSDRERVISLIKGNTA